MFWNSWNLKKIPFLTVAHAKQKHSHQVSGVWRERVRFENWISAGLVLGFLVLETSEKISRRMWVRFQLSSYKECCWYDEHSSRHALRKRLNMCGKQKLCSQIPRRKARAIVNITCRVTTPYSHMWCRRKTEQHSDKEYVNSTRLILKIYVESCE